MDVEKIIVSECRDFRRWLRKNYKKAKKVALVLYKKHTGKKAPSHRELMEEAICFGWIDTTIHRIDENRYIRRFVKRNENSKWSDNTLGYAKDLLKRGRMSKEGVKYYKMGLKKPRHYDGIPKNPDMPSELKSELEKNGKVKKAFEGYSPSRKRMYYRWILSGKMSETRKKRIGMIVDEIKKSIGL
jgi:uncharacterized protein YdeI (YjbR/CyaY-like superfamily)